MSSWYQAAEERARAEAHEALDEAMFAEVVDFEASQMEEESMLAAIDAQVEADASRVEP